MFPHVRTTVHHGGAGSGKNAHQIARELDLTATAVRDWIKQAKVDAGHAPNGELTTAEREELARLRRENKVLQMEREILRKATAFFAKETDVKFAFVAVEKASFPVTVLCKVLDVSRSGFYAWTERAPSARSLEDAKLRVHVAAAYELGRGN